MIRDIVSIDEDVCDGCGRCVPSCAEEAIRIVAGKARLVSDRLCDGLGACLGHCPRGAIRIERREADTFDEAAVGRHRMSASAVSRDPARRPGAGRERHVPVVFPEHQGCPGARLDSWATAPAGALGSRPGDDQRRPTDDGAASDLRQWPVQLRLVPPTAPFLYRAPLLVAADCVPVAFPDFHRALLRGQALVIACPKLDDRRGYVEKLAAMIQENETPAITVARMEVPCCGGILQMVLEARDLAERNVPVEEVVIGIRGSAIARRRHDVEAASSS